MNNLLLSNILDVTTTFVCLFIVVRVCLVYPTVRSPRLLALGISMGIITITAIVDLIASNDTALAAHIDWFLYIGQAVALLFILLSMTSGSDSYLQKLILFQAFASILLVCLLLLSFALPDLPDVVTREIIGSTRFILCIGICFYYISGFVQKQTRFGFLMSACFLFLSIGFLMDLQQYLVPHYAELFDALGDIGRLFGFLALLGAVLAG
jgi:hypothetical protein